MQHWTQTAPYASIHHPKHSTIASFFTRSHSHSSHTSHIPPARTRYVTRRLVRFASEDIGLADPGALLQATAAHTAAERLGMPECDVIIAQCVAYLAMAPKSVAVYKAYGTAKNLVKNAAADPVSCT